MTTWQSQEAHGAYFMLTRLQLEVFAIVALGAIAGTVFWAYRRGR